MNEEMTICEALDETYLRNSTAWKILNQKIKNDHVRIKELEEKLKEEQKLLEHYMEKFGRAMVILSDHKDFWKIYED
jgi:hypothetical protein